MNYVFAALWFLTNRNHGMLPTLWRKLVTAVTSSPSPATNVAKQAGTHDERR